MKYIEEFKDDLVEIYVNDNYENFSVGYIQFEDDKHILVQLIHPMGFKDGEVLILKERINKIQKNTQYLKEIEILMKENSKENILKSYIFNKKEISINKDKDIIEKIIQEAIKKEIICTIESIYDEEKSFGYIRKEEDEYIVMEYKEEKIVIKKDEISAISLDTITQKRDVLVDFKFNIVGKKSPTSTVGAMNCSIVF